MQTNAALETTKADITRVSPVFDCIEGWKYWSFNQQIKASTE
jgi:hypothetical protein